MAAPSETHSKHAAQNTVWSDDYERLPLKHRLKLLLATNRLPLDSDVKSDVILKYCGLAQFNCEKNSENCVSSSDISAPSVSAITGSVKSTSIQESLVVETPVEVKIECGDSVESPLVECVDISSRVVTGANSESKMSIEVLDKLDHVVLKERLRMLLTSDYLGLQSPVLEASHNPSGDSRIEQTEDIPSFTNLKVKPPNHDEFQSSRVTSVGQIPSRSFVPSQTVVQTAFDAHEDDLDQTLLSKRMKLLSSIDGPSLNTDQSSKCMNKMGHSALSCSLVRSKPVPSPKINIPRTIPQSVDSRIEQIPDIPSCKNVKVEPPNLDEFQGPNVTCVGQLSSRNFVLVKTEVQTAENVHEDDLDHMFLSERKKLLSSRDVPSLNSDQSSSFMSKMDHSASSCRPDGSKPVPSLKINRPRKRRKTATDSVEIAMEEDAPGLLQVLIEKGVSLDEIKLYGEPESNDVLDENDSFGELEEVITKLFSQRESLLKYAPVRCSNGDRASYCLECLFSLVEQARYLQFRHWPVEWGWCRELQSFIFVFERHNRIVLERPEYGYATYFFELTDSLPIRWQVKRLVTAMKLTSCSRVTLIENKALMVGEDVSEGEARVLMEYGWIPNTGIGTMLNYYDRVFHDRRKEKDGLEWRSKIGKLLMDGYNGGTLIPTGIPIPTPAPVEEVMEVKVELS